jgi:hypothetical protein
MLFSKSRAREKQEYTSSSAPVYSHSSHLLLHITLFLSSPPPDWGYTPFYSQYVRLCSYSSLRSSHLASSLSIFLLTSFKQLG